MADDLVEQMEQMDLQSPSIFGLPTDVIQKIFNYIREDKDMKENEVRQTPEYQRFMRTPIRPGAMMTPQERLDMVNQAERRFIENQPTVIPAQLALRYFRDLARRRGHDI